MYWLRRTWASGLNLSHQGHLAKKYPRLYHLLLKHPTSPCCLQVQVRLTGCSFRPLLRPRPTYSLLGLPLFPPTPAPSC